MLPMLLGAAVLSATPATLDAQLAAAKGGDTVVLAAGDYGAPKIRDRAWQPAIEIDARAARFSGLTLAGVRGVKIVGLTAHSVAEMPTRAIVVTLMGAQDVAFEAPRISGTSLNDTGMMLRDSQRITVDNAAFTGLRTGVVFNQVVGGHLRDTQFSGMRSDGVNVAGSQNIRVERVRCEKFVPIVPQDHADCVQMWSIKGKPPTADIVIADNVADGDMQGFTGFDHGTGGYDRITITGNTVRTRYPQGIALYNARSSRVEGNDVSTLKPAQFWTQVRVVGATDTVVRNNRIAPRPPWLTGKAKLPVAAQ